MSELRERIARVLWGNMAANLPNTMGEWPGADRDLPMVKLFLSDADAVIADLGLVESKAVYALDDTPAPFRRYVTPWERIEDDA